MAVRVAWEHSFHTAEQVSEYLAEALKIMQAHEVDPTVCPQLTAQLVNLLAAKQVQFEQVGPLGIIGRPGMP